MQMRSRSKTKTTQRSQNLPLSASAQSVDAGFHRRILEMRRMLAATRPQTTADALRVLRDAFPDIPLNRRMQALLELSRR